MFTRALKAKELVDSLVEDGDLGPWNPDEIHGKEQLIELLLALRWRSQGGSVRYMRMVRDDLIRQTSDELRQEIGWFLGGVAVSRKELAAGLTKNFDSADVVPSIEAIADKLNIDFPEGYINHWNSDYEQWGGTPDFGDEGDD